MNRLIEVKLAMGVDKKHKFDDADIGKVASPATGFTHIGVVQGHDVYHRQRNAGNHDFVMTKEGERKRSKTSWKNDAYSSVCKKLQK